MFKQLLYILTAIFALRSNKSKNLLKNILKLMKNDLNIIKSFYIL